MIVKARKLRWAIGPRVLDFAGILDADLVVTGRLADNERPPNSGELVIIDGVVWLISNARMHVVQGSAPVWLLELVKPPRP